MVHSTERSRPRCPFQPEHCRFNSCLVQKTGTWHTDKRHTGRITLDEQSSTPSADVKVAGLMQIPLELRERIYELILLVAGEWQAGSIYIASESDTHWHVHGTTYRHKRDTCPSISTSLLRVCRQMHAEAASVLYGRNSFQFDVSVNDFSLDVDNEATARAMPVLPWYPAYHRLVKHVQFTLDTRFLTGKRCERQIHTFLRLMHGRLSEVKGAFLLIEREYISGSGVAGPAPVSKEGRHWMYRFKAGWDASSQLESGQMRTTFFHGKTKQEATYNLPLSSRDVRRSPDVVKDLVARNVLSPEFIKSKSADTFASGKSPVTVESRTLKLALPYGIDRGNDFYQHKDGVAASVRLLFGSDDGDVYKDCHLERSATRLHRTGWEAFRESIRLHRHHVKHLGGSWYHVSNIRLRDGCFEVEYSGKAGPQQMLASICSCFRRG